MTKFVKIFLPDGTRLKVESEKYEVIDGAIKVTGLQSGKPDVTFPAGNWLRAEMYTAVTEVE